MVESFSQVIQIFLISKYLEVPKLHILGFFLGSSSSNFWSFSDKLISKSVHFQGWRCVNFSGIFFSWWKSQTGYGVGFSSFPFAFSLFIPENVDRVMSLFNERAKMHRLFKSNLICLANWSFRVKTQFYDFFDVYYSHQNIYFSWVN